MADTFAFGELSERAKCRALDNHREKLDYDWWDTTYEDVIATAGLLGIEIGNNESRTRAGKPVSDPDISFSGFSSQGDGCSWGGVIWVENMEKAIAVIEQERPSDEDLSTLAKQADEIFKQITAVHVAQKLTPQIDFDQDRALAWADCYPTVHLSIENISRTFTNRVRDGHYDIPLEVENAVDEFCGDFANWVYAQLEAEHDYLTSDDYTKERIEGDDLKFDEDGNDA